MTTEQELSALELALACGYLRTAKDNQVMLQRLAARGLVRRDAQVRGYRLTDAGKSACRSPAEPECPLSKVGLVGTPKLAGAICPSNS